MIPPSFIHDLLTHIDIVEVVGRYVQLKKGGVNVMGLCPFHAEKSPSFSVSPTKQFFHCFGCGASGDAIRFLTEFSGASFVEAVEDLAQQAGMTVPQDDVTPAERERFAEQRERESTLTDVLIKAAEHFRVQLKRSPRAIDYLKHRGMTGEIAARFGLGYAPEGWRGLASVFARYDDPLLETSGMVISQPASDTSAADPKRYDRFRDRIMFPIRSVRGDVIGFGGRVLAHGEPKYLNSPETPVFSKGRELYGLDLARAALRQRGHALVVEGYMDVLALAQSGFGNAVATLGTACTAEQVQKLFRFTDSVVFSFDGDAAGRRAAGRALEACLPYATDTRKVRFLFLPAEHDPDSYVREHGPLAFERCIETAVPLSRQMIDMASEGNDLASAEGRTGLLVGSRPLWNALPEGALKRQVLGELAVLGHLESGELMSMWSGQAATGGAAVRGPSGSRLATRRASRSSKGATNLLDRALWLLFHRSQIWAQIANEAHDLLAAQTRPYGALFSCVERSVHEHGTLTQAAMLVELRHQIPEPDAEAVIVRIEALHQPGPTDDLLHEMNLIIDRLRLQAVQDELKLLFESGLSLPQAHQRGKILMAEQSLLKAKLSQVTMAGAQ